MVNFAQTPESHRTTNNIALKAAIQGFARSKEKNMKASTEDKIKGKLLEVKGAIKEQAGKLTDNCCLEARGKAEKLTGKAQHCAGDAEAAVENLKK
jgi:uncharacterized protein YjbJ (UPF0337 family)